MNTLPRLFFFLLLCTALSCKEKDRPQKSPAVPTTIITDSAVQRLDRTLQSYVAQGHVAGISALIYEQGEEAYFNAFGFADREAQKPMDRSTIVQIYSMTKPVTGVALMTLYEQGKFKLDDPIAHYAPEYANMVVHTGMDEAGNLLTEPLQRPITIRDVTRHTAGFPNRVDIPGLGELWQAADLYDRESTLSEMAEKMGKVPLWFQPGTQWEYGPSVDVQALLVERISGLPYKEYLQKNVLGPLKMTETRYFIPEADRHRFAQLYIRKGEGKLIRDSLTRSNYTKPWPLTRGGSGLTSTLDDYMRFAQMLVQEGHLGETQILAPETVRLMATNQLSDSISERSWLPSKGQVGFGIDFAVRTVPPKSSEENYGEVGEFFWDGAASTLFWVDPKNELTAVLFVQLFPYDGIGLHKAFRDAVYGQIENGNQQ